MFAARTALIEDNPAQYYTGIAVADLDGDGACECIAASGSRNLILKWGGDAFFDVGVPALWQSRIPTTGVAAADADGDGREELYFASAEGAPDQLLAWRQGQWRNLLDGPRQSSQSVVACDRFGMGRYGFLVANEGGPFRFFELRSEDRVEECAAELGLARIAGGRSLLAAPLTGNGVLIYAGNEGITNMLFEPAANARFDERAVSRGLGDSASASRGIAAIDANFDGRWDILRADASGPTHLFLQGAQGNFQKVELDTPARIRSVVVADFDNDGFEEIFLHAMGEPNRLLAWRNGRWQPIDCGAATEPEGCGLAAIAADFNQDGFLELLLGHGELMPQHLSLFTVEPNGNHWLRIAPLTANGAPARGAQVRIPGQMRVIDSGSGYLSQSEPVAHFGLGQRTQIDWVEITWPSGEVLRIDAPAIDQTLKCTLSPQHSGSIFPVVPSKRVKV